MGSVMALIPAAGKGLRMESDIEKPYLQIGDRPMLAHTLDAFDRCPEVDGYVLVVDPGRQDDCREQVVDRFGYGRVQQIVSGGATRQESVYLGLQALGPDVEVVIVHDAARPCIDSALITASVEHCWKQKAILVAVPVKDTVKVVEEGVVTQTPDRATLWLAQTPQTFVRPLLMEAHEHAGAEGYEGTDDAALVERIGQPVHILSGDYENIKVTTPEDLETASQILSRRQASADIS